MIHKAAGSRPHRKRLREHGAPEEQSEASMEPGFRFVNVPATHPGVSLAYAALQGLSKPQKELPSRFFYDIEGSRLFERITRLPEYYLTRCETEILEQWSGEIVEFSVDDLQIIEFGSGSSEKTRLLLRSAVHRQDEVEYVPIDISSEFLRDSSAELLDEIDGVRVTALAGDYMDAMLAIPFHDGPRLFLFLGSTVGNFEPEEAIDFLSRVREGMRSQDRFLVGLDLKKSPEIIEPAYNDAEGVTALFNKNILARINREICGHFDLSGFSHEAPWVEEHSRIEMRLVASQDQVVVIDGIEQSFSFRQGEFIHTENSHKWSEDAFEKMCSTAGLSTSKIWHDSKGWFALTLLEVTAD